jgi:hypothetical protein
MSYMHFGREGSLGHPWTMLWLLRNSVRRLKLDLESVSLPFTNKDILLIRITAYHCQRIDYGYKPTFRIYLCQGMENTI